MVGCCGLGAVTAGIGGGRDGDVSQPPGWTPEAMTAEAPEQAPTQMVAMDSRPRAAATQAEPAAEAAPAAVAAAAEEPAVAALEAPAEVETERGAGAAVLQAPAPHQATRRRLLWSRKVHPQMRLHLLLSPRKTYRPLKRPRPWRLRPLKGRSAARRPARRQTQPHRMPAAWRWPRRLHRNNRLQRLGRWALPKARRRWAWAAVGLEAVLLTYLLCRAPF